MSSANAINTNEVQPKGEVLNLCGFTVTNVKLELYGYIQCQYVSQGSDDFTNMPTRYVGGYNTYTGLLTGRCEDCVKGVSVDWPPFTIVSQADATGVGPNNQQVEDSGPAERTTSLQNSINYTFPCP